MSQELDLSHLFEHLKNKGYNGDLSDIAIAILKAEKKQVYNRLHEQLDVVRNNATDKGRGNIDYVRSLIAKLFEKYPVNSINTQINHSFDLHFCSNIHPRIDKVFNISIYIKDNRNAGRDGYYGAYDAHITWGYEESRKVKQYIFIEEEAY